MDPRILRARSETSGNRRVPPKTTRIGSLVNDSVNITHTERLLDACECGLILENRLGFEWMAARATYHNTVVAGIKRGDITKDGVELGLVEVTSIGINGADCFWVYGGDNTWTQSNYVTVLVVKSFMVPRVCFGTGIQGSVSGYPQTSRNRTRNLSKGMEEKIPGTVKYNE
jgi:hypothetical protein